MSTPYPGAETSAQDFIVNIGKTLSEKGEFKVAYAPTRIVSLAEAAIKNLPPDLGITAQTEGLGLIVDGPKGRASLKGSVNATIRTGSNEVRQASAVITECEIENNQSVFQATKERKLKLSRPVIYKLDITQIPQDQRELVEQGLRLGMNQLSQDPTRLIAMGLEKLLADNKFELKITGLGLWIQENGAIAVVVRSSKK